MLEPCLLCGAPYNIYHQCSLIFRQASPEPLRGKVAISFNLLQSVSYNLFYAQCSSLFRRAWNAIRSSSIYLIYIFISAAWFSDWPFSGAVTRQGDVFWYAAGHYLHFWLYWYNAPVLLLGGSGWSHVYIVNLQWLSIGFGKWYIPWPLVTVWWCTSASALRTTN